MSFTRESPQEGTDPTAVPFVKGEALGNDYIVVDAAEVPRPLGPAEVRALCDRYRGVGGDGVLLGDVGRDPVGLRIFNPDGGEAEKSGNGLRIFGAYLHHRGLVGLGDEFGVVLPEEEVRMRIEGVAEAGALDVTVAMGRASFSGADVGYAPDAGEVLGRTVELGEGMTADVCLVSVGNPHCVVFVEALERADFLARAPRLATLDAFTRGTNVQFARVAGPGALEVWIWERGAGETLASGSSASAAAAAAVRTGRVDAGTIGVDMPGGAVEVSVDGSGAVRLRGPARILYEGRLRAEVFAAWRGAG